MQKGQTRVRASLEVRKRNYHYDESIPKYYDSNNAVLTAEWDALALVIPSGERFFIQSVQRMAHRAKDPQLKAQIKGFVGQETMHAKEIERSLQPLLARGFPVKEFQDWFDRFIERSRIWLERIFFFMTPGTLALASTAASEHFTAVISAWDLKTGYANRLPPAIRDNHQWHAAEELEHKSVAFDLLQEVAPCNYVIRQLGFFFAAILVGWAHRKAMRMLFKWDGLSGAKLREERRQARCIRIPLLSLRFPHVLRYLRPGFHPNDLDDGTLSKQILTEQARRDSLMALTGQVEGT